MRWECAREAPALGITFHSLAWEGAGEFFIGFSPETMVTFFKEACSLCFLMYFLKKGRNYGGLRYLE
jgi:hypothetical protein